MRSLFKSKFKSVSQPKPAERRSRKRHDWALMVHCNTGSKVPARTLDISEDSVRIITRQELREGDEMMLELYLNEGDIFGIRFRGVCVWSRQSDVECIAGFNLSGSKSRNLEFLRELVSRF